MTYPVSPIPVTILSQGGLKSGRHKRKGFAININVPTCQRVYIAYRVKNSVVRQGVPLVGLCIQPVVNIYDTVRIVITDAGPGIPHYAAERLFERFYSLPRPDGGKSTGLGLPFVREVAALHGGAVTVGNGEHGGCRAELNLPLPLRL